jgi:hypothetical protein
MSRRIDSKNFRNSDAALNNIIDKIIKENEKNGN